MTPQLAMVQANPALPGYALPPVPSQGTRVILLRHGRSTLNDAGCYQGSSDLSDLTAKGRLASRQVGQFLRHCPIDHLYASPLRRAQQTVQELLPQLEAIASPSITVLGVLREIELPAWEGLLYAEVKTRFPDAYRCWQTTPEQLVMERLGREVGDGALRSEDYSEDLEDLIYPVRDVYRRAREFWATTLPQHQGQTLLVVSHGGTIQALVNTAVGLPMRQYHALQQTHSGLTVIDFDAPIGNMGHLHLLNLTTPIGEQLPKLKAGKQGLRLVLLPCQEALSPDSSLARLVQGDSIAVSVIEDLPCCQHSQRSLLIDHPETVALAVEQADFLPYWQRSLAPWQSMSTSELITIAVVCHQAQAESFLRELAGYALPLLPNALTILHYPDMAMRPILQTLNSRPTPLDVIMRDMDG